MIDNFSEVLEDESYVTKAQSNITVKINTHSIEDLRKLVRYLNDTNIIHHAYQIKQERSYRIVLRGLHYSIPREDIKKKLEKKGHKVKHYQFEAHGKQGALTDVLRRSRAK
ncbi:unnamed protein product [Psylliodes chrysocephalus]|uniref:Uncharacterized protein n=1 Tax=Psylliodes chrysocephalus TaxID=3402493 RepID=A0A9P0D4V5_9CUCU|nr:unnamed protein product [Psylliodes chrysocephala]